MSQDYLSIVGRSASSKYAQSFFSQHNSSWNDVVIYEERGLTKAVLELYDSALSIEFIKKLLPRSSITHQQKDFIVSSITFVNHGNDVSDKIGRVTGNFRLISKLPEMMNTLGEPLAQDHNNGDYSWRKEGVKVEVDYDTSDDEINYIVLIADTPEIKAAREVADSLSDIGFAEATTEELGIEPPDVQYHDQPVESDFDNMPVVERDKGTRIGPLMLIILVLVALYFHEDISKIMMQLIKPFI